MKSKAFIFRLIIVIAMFIVAGIFYSQLPETIPTHWNIQGQPDDWGAKTWVAWLMPGIGLAVLILLPVLAKIDPRSRNYPKFSGAFEVIQTVIILLFAFFFFLQYYMTLKPEHADLMPPLILGFMGISFMVMGNYMGKVRQNYFVGIKTPWTLNDPEIWQKSHRVSGWVFVAAGVIFLLQAWLQIYLTLTFIIVMSGLILIPTFYSYLLYRRKHSPKL